MKTMMTDIGDKTKDENYKDLEVGASDGSFLRALVMCENIGY